MIIPPFTCLTTYAAMNVEIDTYRRTKELDQATRAPQCKQCRGDRIRIPEVQDESSHHTSMSKRPNVAASEVQKATMIARLIRVIMPGLRSASSVHAPRMKTRPP